MVVEVRFGVIQEGVLSHGSKWPPEATKGKVPWLKLESNMTIVGSLRLRLVHPLLHQPA